MSPSAASGRVTPDGTCGRGHEDRAELRAREAAVFRRGQRLRSVVPDGRETGVVLSALEFAAARERDDVERLLATASSGDDVRSLEEDFLGRHEVVDEALERLALALASRVAERQQVAATAIERQVEFLVPLDFLVSAVAVGLIFVPRPCGLAPTVGGSW